MTEVEERITILLKLRFTSITKARRRSFRKKVKKTPAKQWKVVSNAKRKSDKDA